jgi:hypothetical protein
MPASEYRALRGCASEHGVTLKVVWEYATDLFDQATIEALAWMYRQLLTQWVADPGLPLSSLPVAASARAGGVPDARRRATQPPSPCTTS